MKEREEGIYGRMLASVSKVVLVLDSGILIFYLARIDRLEV